MYLDIEDYRPDTPRVSTALSTREAILMSLLVHAGLVILWLVMPPSNPVTQVPVVPAEHESVQFVHMVPRTEVLAQPKPEAQHSDLDRRATQPTPAPDPQNAAPFSRGDTPEKVVGAPVEKPAGPEPTPAPPSTAAPTLPSLATKVTPDTSSITRPAGGGLGSSLRNLQQFLQTQNFDNQAGGQSVDPNQDIQFDSKGVEFGPWLRRFVAQVKRNWFFPQAAMMLHGNVVIQFHVLRNGTITDIKIVRPSTVDSFNINAFNALKNSSPTLPLPPEFPDDRILITVTFHYNEGVGRSS